MTSLGMVVPLLTNGTDPSMTKRTKVGRIGVFNIRNDNDLRLFYSDLEDPYYTFNLFQAHCHCLPPCVQRPNLCSISFGKGPEQAPTARNFVRCVRITRCRRQLGRRISDGCHWKESHLNK